MLKRTVRVKVGAVVPETMDRDKMVESIIDYKNFIRGMLMKELGINEIIVDYNGATLKVSRVPLKHAKDAKAKCVELTALWVAPELTLGDLKRMVGLH